MSKFNTDKPIHNSTEDLLGRKIFSKTLAEAVNKYKGTDSLVIGLFGKWGVGKTSNINMILENLNDKIIVHFSPWNYSSQSDLINIFFNVLRQSLSKNNHIQDNQALGETLFQYAKAVKSLSLIPVVGEPISNLLQIILEMKGESLTKPQSLEEIRKNLENELIKIDKKIIIVIDDIDRLTNEQIRDIFQLVKQVANFPNVIYLLSMDREIVCRALNEVQKVDGHEYLDKIIQIPIEIPELRKSKLHDILLQKLDLIRDSFTKKIVVDSNYFSKVFQYCVMPYVATLRDVNKIINTFTFRVGVLYEETCFEDMLALTVLEVLEPKLYRWIAGNKDNLCGGFMHGVDSNRDNANYFSEKYNAEFKELGINTERATKFLATIFPVFAKDVQRYSYDYNSLSEAKKYKRVADIDKFDLYFIFDFDDVKVPRKYIDAFVFDIPEDDLKENLEKYNNEGSMYYFIDEVHSMIDNIPKERLTVMAKTLLSFQGNYSGRKESWLMPIAAKKKANYLAEDILKRIKNENERFEVIQYAVNNVEAKGLGQLGVLINTIELAYGRLAGENEKQEDQIISSEQLLEIEKIFSNRIQKVAEEGAFLEIIDMRIACYLWKSFDENSFREFISEKLTDKIYKLKFLCTLAGEWNGTEGKGWGYSLKEFSEYILDEDVYNLIKELNKTELNSFSQIEKIKLASFVLNYEAKDEYHTTIEAAQTLVEEWEEKD